MHAGDLLAQIVVRLKQAFSGAFPGSEALAVRIPSPKKKIFLRVL